MNAIATQLKSWIELADLEMRVVVKRVEMWNTGSPDATKFIGESLVRLVEVHDELFGVAQKAIRSGVSHPYYRTAERILGVIRFAVRYTDPVHHLEPNLSSLILNKANALEASELADWLEDKPTEEFLRESLEQIQAGEVVSMMPAASGKS